MYTLEELRDKTFKELKALGYELNTIPAGDKRCRQNWVDAIAGVLPPLLELLETSPGVEVEQRQEPIDVQRTEPIESKFGRIVYSRAIVQLPETFQDIQQNHAEPNRTGAQQIGTDEIAIGAGIHQQCLNTSEPDGSNDGAQTKTLGSQKGDRILAAAGNGQAIERRPLPRESNELTATFSDDRPPNRGDNGRDRLESEPILSRTAIELVVRTSKNTDRLKSKSSTAHQLLDLFKSRAHILPEQPIGNIPGVEVEPVPGLVENIPGVTFSDSFLARYSPPKTENIHYRAGADGQLSLFDFELEVADEPPDPDDFESLDAFWKAMNVWDAQHPEPLERSESSSTLEVSPVSVESSSTLEVSPVSVESSSTYEFLIPVFAWCDRTNGNDEPPTAGVGARRPPPKPPTFGPVMVVAGDRANSIKKFARCAVHSSGRAPPGGDATLL